MSLLGPCTCRRAPKGVCSGNATPGHLTASLVCSAWPRRCPVTQFLLPDVGIGTHSGFGRTWADFWAEGTGRRGAGREAGVGGSDEDPRGEAEETPEDRRGHLRARTATPGKPHLWLAFPEGSGAGPCRPGLSPEGTWRCPPLRSFLPELRFACNR